MRKKTTSRLMEILVLTQILVGCACDGIIDILSPFLDATRIAGKAAVLDASGGGSTMSSTNGTFVPVDDAYPLAPQELQLLLQMHQKCRTPESTAMRTWCTGGDEDSHLDDEEDDVVLCPRGVQTHPCTGRVLRVNRSVDEDGVEFFWPWEGIRCDAYTEPTTITHIYLPGENLQCELAELDLSVMVSLEQLDLSKNLLHGRLPEWLGGMTVLRLLNLNDNKLTGDIPSSFAGNDALEHINLAGNQFTASSLAFFDAFHRLRHLDLSRNLLALELPNSVVASGFLQSINLSHNELRGQLPELRVFQFLVSFDLSSNHLSGQLPVQLSLWGREDPHDPDEKCVLEVIDVSDNLLNGDLPTISNLTALRRFDVHGNGFSGVVPAFPPKLLESVKPSAFDGNAFSCPLPAALLPSNLTCVCGNGRFIANVSTNSSSTTNHSHPSVVLASEAVERCVPCPDGFYSNATTDQQCHPCPAGSTHGGPAAYCSLCIPGTFANSSGASACTPCPAGSFTSEDGAVSCDLCDPGEFAAVDGSSECSLCPIGSYSGRSGTSKCSLCPVGTFTNVDGEGECMLCSVDTYQDAVGSTECKSCPVGSVARQVGHLKCLPCPRGSFYDQSAKTCQRCAPDTFSGDLGQLECTRCANGTVAEGYSNERCLAAAFAGLGYGFDDVGAIATECEPGTFNDGKWRTCQICPAGSFSAIHSAKACLPCPRGSFTASERSLSCEKAPAGSFIEYEGATRSEPCPSGSVASTVGSIACLPCQAPSFSLLSGGTECSFAGLGEVYERVVWPRMELMLVGVALEDLVSLDGGRDAVLNALIGAWTDTLAGYMIEDTYLHVLQVQQPVPAEEKLRVVAAVEMVAATSEKTAEGKWAQKAKEAIDAVEKAAESTLNDLLDDFTEPSGSSEADPASEGAQLEDLVTTSSFREALARQLSRVRLLDGALSPRLLSISMVEPPLNATRAVPCPPGTFFSLREDAGGQDDGRQCLQCPRGFHSTSSGSLTCLECPHGTYAGEDGLSKCSQCRLGTDAAPGATSCVACSWFTHECEGFWEDVVAVVCLGIAALRLVYAKTRRLCIGDRSIRQQNEQMALLTAVRTHGRTLEGVRYEPMGEVSADMMIGATELKMQCV